MKINIIKIITLLFLLSIGTGLYGTETIPQLFEESYNLEEKRNYGGALNKVLKVIRQDTKNYTAHIRAGWLFYCRKDYDTSISYYKKAMTIKPRAIEPALGMTYPLMAARQWKRAEKLTRSIIRKDTYNYSANSKLAYILFSQGKYSKAKKYYERLLNVYPSNITMKLGLAWTYLRLGNKYQAAIYFNKVLQVKRNNQNAIRGISLTK